MRNVLKKEREKTKKQLNYLKEKWGKREKN